MNTLIFGLSYGDEGKGRAVSYFIDSYDWVVRFNGGPNAGHTVYKDNKQYKFHQLPSGAIFGKKVALDTGMVLDYDKLVKECEENGIDLASLYISRNVHLITPAHKLKDADGSGIGSTKSGIGPAYENRANRLGVRVGNDWSVTTYGKIPTFYFGLPPFEKDANVLYESAQGIMIDVDYGCYPYVTSSSVGPSCWHRIDNKVGVMKSYVTRVGDGPPYKEDLSWLRDKAGEFGTTTGRPRKCHWLDLDELDYAVLVTNPDEIFVVKMDILVDVEEIKVYEKGKEKIIGNIEAYKKFLLSRYPKIRYMSYSPSGAVEIVS